jgi:hypothetical protein
MKMKSFVVIIVCKRSGYCAVHRSYKIWSRVTMNSLYLPSVHLRAALPHIIIGREVRMKIQLKAPISHITSVTDCASSQLPVANVNIMPKVLLTTATPTIPSILSKCQYAFNSISRRVGIDIHHVRITVHEICHGEIPSTSPTKTNEA